MRKNCVIVRLAAFQMEGQVSPCTTWYRCVHTGGLDVSCRNRGTASISESGCLRVSEKHGSWPCSGEDREAEHPHRDVLDADLVAHWQRLVAVDGWVQPAGQTSAQKSNMRANPITARAHLAQSSTLLNHRGGGCGDDLQLKECAVHLEGALDGGAGVARHCRVGLATDHHLVAISSTHGHSSAARGNAQLLPRQQGCAVHCRVQHLQRRNRETGGSRDGPAGVAGVDSNSGSTATDGGVADNEDQTCKGNGWRGKEGR